MPANNSILILTEAGPQFGIGHWRRCQALAVAPEAAQFQVELRQNDFSVPNQQYAAVIIDSYHLPEAGYAAFESITDCLVVIDDNNRLKYPAQLIVNPSLGAAAINYDTTAELLLGSKFALLNQLYWTAKPVTISAQLTTVLLTLGGSALAQQAAELKQQLSTVLPELKFIASDGQQTPAEMFHLYHQADAVISGGGQTLHELACLGLPTVALKMADNQEWNLTQWSKVGFIPESVSIADPDVLPFLTLQLKAMSYDYRQQVAGIGRQYVDGLGAQRVVKWIQAYVNS